MRGRSAVSTDLDGLYAAQRLTMVRLAVLLVGDRDVAESVVQRAFLVLLRRHDRRADPGTAVAELRGQVVAGCRAVLRGRQDDPAPSSVRDTIDDVRRLPPRQCEVVVLDVWARLSRPQTAATLRVGERTVAAARTSRSTRFADRTSRRTVRQPSTGSPRRSSGRPTPSAPTTSGVGSGTSSTTTPGGRRASVGGGCWPSPCSSSWPSSSPSAPASSTTPARLRRRPPHLPRRRPRPTARSPRPRSRPVSAREERSRGPRSAPAGS